MSRSDPQNRKVYRRRRIIVFGSLGLVVALLLSGSIYIGTTLSAPVPAAAASVVEVPDATQPAATIAWPDFGRSAVGAVGFDGVLASSGDQSVIPIASITKLVTALVVLDAHPLQPGEHGPEITYTDVDVEIYWDTIAEGGSAAPVVDGSILTLRQSLEAMLIPSANNYSTSLAVWAYGSIDAYLTSARVWLDAHGLTQTSVADTSGLSPESVSSPSDLVELGKLALAHPTIAEIVAMPSAHLPIIGTVVNTNKLLGMHGVDGVKTGTTDEAGACLLFSADYAVGSQTITVVGVMLGGDTHPQLNAAIAALLESVAPAFHEVSVIEAGEALTTYETVWGDTATGRAVDSISVLVWNDTPITIEVETDEIVLSDDGAMIGTVTVNAGETAFTTPIELDGSLEDPGTWWRLTNPGALSG